MGFGQNLQKAGLGDRIEGSVCVCVEWLEGSHHHWISHMGWQKHALGQKCRTQKKRLISKS